MRCVAALPCLLLAFPALAANLLPNADFEGAFAPTGIAAQWADDSSWADLTVRYAPDRARPHSGRACQGIVCPRVSYGAVQFIPEGGVRLRKGGLYRVRAWLRGDVGPVALQLRLAPLPYTIYVERGLTVGPRWRQLEYLWTATVDDPEARFMVRFGQEGSLWVDDVSVEELTPEQALTAAPPVRPGNLLHNGDFDLGTANWLVNHGCDDWREPTLAIVREAGNPGLRVVVPDGVYLTLAADVVSVVEGRPVRLSCRLRTDPAAKVVLASNHCWQQVSAGPQWQTAQATGATAFGDGGHDYARFGVTGPVTLWLDDVTLRQDAADGPAYGPRAAIISERHPLSLYHDGEEPVLRLLTSVPGGKPVACSWRVEDFWGQTVRAGRVTAPAGRQEWRLSGKGLRRGWYRATVTWRDGPAERLNQSTFAVLPPPERRSPLASSPYGAHFAVDRTGLALARAVGCRWLRLHPPNHTKWRVVEPTKGDWQWRDEPIRLAKSAGLELVGSLDRCPPWASSAPSGTPDNEGFYQGPAAWLPRDWTEWEEYVARTVRRYRGDIRVWEIWNEPDYASWLRGRDGQTQAAAYYELMQHTTPIVRREDPEATIIGGCPAGLLYTGAKLNQFGEELIALGGLELMDVFSFHQYLVRTIDEGGTPIHDWVPRFHQAMQAAGRDLPLINSEGGFGNPGAALSYRPADADTVSADLMARWLVRQHVAQFAQGIKQFFFYNFFVDGSPVTRSWEGFVEGDGQPRPNVAAYAAMTWLLDGAEFAATAQPSPDVWLHRFTTPRGAMVVAWTRTGTTARHAFRGAKAAWDLMGAPLRVPPDGLMALSDAPVYVLLGG